MAKLAIRYFQLEGQKASPAVTSLQTLPAKFRAAVFSDIELVAEYGFSAPVSVKSIKGHTPMMEIRTGNHRIFFVVDRGEMWVLGCCKKQDQQHAIEVAAERMKLVRER